MRKIITVLIVLSCMIPFAAMANGQQEEKPQKIVFADLTWDSAMVHNRIAAYIIENGLEGSYEVDYMAGATAPSWTGVEGGSINVIMESYHSNLRDIYDDLMSQGKILDLGKNLPDAPQGWYLPRYVIEGDAERGIEALAPGLESIENLDEYAELFTDREDPSKGLIYIGIAGWQVTEDNQEVFEEYNLGETFNYAIPGSTSAVAATMDSAYMQGEAWIGYWWEPTAIMGRLDMVRLPGTELPPADINIIVNAGLKETAPEIVDFLSNYSTTIAQNNEFLAAMEEMKTDAQGAAEWFLKNREDVWTEWVSSDVAARVRAALQE